jgi:hypothetical protein
MKRESDRSVMVNNSTNINNTNNPSSSLKSLNMKTMTRHMTLDIIGIWSFVFIFPTFSSPEAKAQVNFAHQFQLAPVIFPYLYLLPKNQWPKLDHTQLNGTLSMNLFAKFCRDFPDIFNRHISFWLDKKRLDEIKPYLV